MKIKFKIKGLDCANCAEELERAIRKIDVIEDASISFIMEKLVVECADDKKDEALEKIKKVIKREEPDVKIEEV